MTLKDFLFGKPLATEEDEGERVGPLAGVPVLGLDALSSAAYGPEALLTVLLPLGARAPRYLGGLTLVTLVLLFMLYLSYRQTIDAYPNGGGAYTVAKENLGERASLFAAAALVLDYVLNVAVAISAGVGALVSALPILLPHTLPLCLAILVLITLINLRGVRESGFAFALPTYLTCIAGSTRCASEAPGSRCSPMSTAPTTSRRCYKTWASRSPARRCWAWKFPSAASGTEWPYGGGQW